MQYKDIDAYFDAKWSKIDILDFNPRVPQYRRLQFIGYLNVTEHPYEI